MGGIWAFIKRKPLAGLCLFILVFFLILAFFGSWLAPSNPLTTNLYESLEGPSWDHWFGTDALGRDVFSRVIAGAKLSYIVAVVATVLSLGGGLIIALVSTYYGGRVDTIIQRFVDIGMALPMLVLAIAIMSVLGASVTNVILAITLTQVTRSSRVFRSNLLSIRETEYVMAARALGASAFRVMGRHMLPNTFAVAVIYSAAYLGAAVLTEASLSFLGLGIPPPIPAWGRDLSDAQKFWAVAPWLAVWPGIALSLFVLAANLLGDALRDDLDPRLKRV